MLLSGWRKIISYFRKIRDLKNLWKIKYLKRLWLKSEFFLSGTKVERLHFHQSNWRSGNIPCYSWEHYQLQQGNIFPAQIPVVTQFFPSHSWKLSQLCFPYNCWYISQVQPVHCPRINLWIVPAFHVVRDSGGRIIDNRQIDNRQIDNWQIDNQNLQIDNLQITFIS